MTKTAATSSSLIGALHAAGPARDRAQKLGLYGFLIGQWEMDAVIYGDDGSKRQDRGEIHAGWVLEGRAIQDVWIIPGTYYGTTLRVYDPGLDAWHILWIDPVMQAYPRQLGRARGADIVQEGEDGAGGLLRWRFVDITPDSFHWLGERSPDRATWRLQHEYFARRVTS